MKLYAHATNGLSTFERLDQIHMRPVERRVARAYVLQAELFAAILVRVDADLRRVFGFFRRAIGASAHHGKMSTVPPGSN